ncbi:hypothetical protein SUGI_0812290 [Cryptomeria japonica]|uniref:cytochrome P450 720B2-like n=1 Tax=Cryptomeria japonica TaxID=3369 RepID=UPI002414C2E3|nr:cytochrome P450 720B2-like [Cryptomeria japonica]GLJ39739.1 hypothetical protein SUGI_0812290 [Cryptomeria japonica]
MGKEQMFMAVYSISQSSVFLTGFVLGAVWIVSRLWASWRSSKISSCKLPPGSNGWPLIGENITFFRAINSTTNHPRQFSIDREKRYGPVFRSNLFGSAKTVVSVDAEFNKYVLQNEGRLFQAKYPSSNNNLMGKYGMVTVHGELQRKLHATAVNLLRAEKMSTDFMYDIQNALSTAMEKWAHLRDIHLQHECHKVVLNLMAKKLLDLAPSQEMDGIYKAFKDFARALVCLPINIPGSTYYKGMKARNIIIRTIHESIKERREHPEVERNDLLTKLLKDGSLSDEIIADFLVFFLFAGYETSSTVMAFSIMFLTQNQQALQELKDEHFDLLKSKGNEKITWEDYKSMKFTHCVIKETLRLGNVAPLIPREAKQDIKVKDFVIPRGWSILVFLNATHLDEKYYSKALTFNPWRWQNEGHEFSNKAWFMPFGKGGRLCPGYHLARLEIALFLHKFITKFRWEKLEDDHISYFPAPTLVKGLPIRVYPNSIQSIDGKMG